MKNNLTDLSFKKLAKDVKPSVEWRRHTKSEIILFARNNQPSRGWEMNTQKFAISFAFALLLVFIPIGYISAKASLPGSKLYPVKRFVENKQIYLTGDNVKRIWLKKKFVKVRLAELEQSIITGDEIASELALLETEKSVLEIIDLDSRSQNEQSLIEVKDKLKSIEQVALSPVIKEKVKLIYNLIDETDTEINQVAIPTATPTKAVKLPTTHPSQPTNEEINRSSEKPSSVEGISTQVLPTSTPAPTNSPEEIPATSSAVLKSIEAVVFQWPLKLSNLKNL